MSTVSMFLKHRQCNGYRTQNIGVPAESAHRNVRLLIIRLTDYRGEPFNVDSCVATIYYPNKTAYVSNQAMSQSPIAGNWYRYDNVPVEEGTYEQNVVCQYGSKSTTTSQSFHVNPALNFIKNVDADVLSVDARLVNVNASVTGTVVDAQKNMTTNLNVAETNLNNLLNRINQSISTELSDVNGTLNTKLTNVHLALTTQLADSNTSIITRIDEAETNLTTLITRVNTSVAAQLTSLNASLNSQLINTNASITGLLNDVEVRLTTRINTAETNLRELSNAINNSLSTQLLNTGNSLDTKLNNINVSLVAELGDTQTVIQSKITDVNASISNLVSTMSNDIKAYLVEYLPVLKKNTEDIYNDTQWIVTNAMIDRASIDARFNSIDGNVTLVEDFCKNTITNSSVLCQEVYNLKTTLNTVRAEQTSYFETLNQTTTNTWNLLSGDIATNINSLLSNVGIIRGQTTQINATVEQIREDQTSQVYVHIIS